MGVNGIYGLSGSGLDIESMVKVGMMGKQNEYDKMQQKYTKNEWTKAAYLELSSSITTFNISTLSQYKMSSSMNSKTATSTSSALKVTANASAAVMNHTVSVTQLGSSAYLIGTEKMTRYNSTTGSSYKSDETGSSGTRLMDVLVKSYINETAEGDEDNGDRKVKFVNGTTGTYNTKTKEFTLEDGTSLGEIAFSFTVGNGEDTADPITVSYEQLLEGNRSFSTLMSNITNTGLNIKASYDINQDAFSFYNSDGGAAKGIEFTFGNDEAGSLARTFFNQMGLVQSQNGKLVTKDENGNYVTTTKAAGVIKFNDETGEDVTSVTDSGSTVITGQSYSFMGTYASITVDGIEYDNLERNQVTVGGITYSANEIVSNASVTVSQDVDGIVDKVKSFIEDYNKLLSSLYEKYDEKPNSDYPPLTQSQKDTMKDEQVEKWEKKAKEGLLYHDRTIGKIITQVREAVVSEVKGLDGKYNSVYTIGISTTGTKGQLTLNEDKLRAALNDDPDSVYNVFAKLGNVKTTNASGKEVSDTNYDGIAQRLGDIFTDATKSIKDRAGSSADITEDSQLNNLLRQLQTRMSNFKKMMSSFEDALYKKYDAMEAALAKLGTQLNYITSGQ